MPDRTPTNINQRGGSKKSVSQGQSKLRTQGVTAPKYVMKMMEKKGTDAAIRLFFSKDSLIADMIEHWGKCDIIVQEFVIQKTLQACVYRFYRNSRNVFKAECIINKKSITKD